MTRLVAVLGGAGQGGEDLDHGGLLQGLGRCGGVVVAATRGLEADRDVLGAVWDRLTTSALAPAFTSASTLLGVAQLGFSGQLVEVDLTAALPG